MKQWLNIKTAPKDGTLLRLKRVFERRTISAGVGYFGDVTIYYAGGPFVSVEGQDYAEPSAHTYTGVWITEDGAHLFPTPTHWMPRPRAAKRKPPQEPD